MNDDHKTTEHGADRRRWLRGALGVLSGVPLIALATTYLQQQGTGHGRTVALGTMDELFGERQVRAVAVDGRPILLIRDAATSVRALSLQCTHAGCPLELHHASLQCHCHGGAFDLQGKPTAGPPRRPLQQFDVIVDAGTVFVRLPTQGSTL